MESKIASVIGDDQFGFIKGRGTREAIATMRLLTERSLEYNNDICIAFIDFEKAFDRVDWIKLLKELKKIGVDWKDRRLIASLYMNQTALVRTNSGVSAPSVIGRGVRQGCLLSPALFNVFAEAMVRDALTSIEEGVKVGGRCIQAVRFADDQAMVASSQQGLQVIMNSLNAVVERYGMRINIKKTKVMRSNKTNGDPLTIMLGGSQLEEVKNFRYLGSLLTADGSCEKEIRTRIAMAKAAFGKHRMILTRSMNLELRKRLVKILVWSVMLYGSEVWTLRKTDIRHLEAAEMWFWRRMEKIIWTDKVTNEAVLRRIGEERSLISTIYRRQKKWLGHTLRHECLLRDVMEGRMVGKRGRGRKRTTFFEHWRRDGETYGAIKRRAEDRRGWRLCC